MSVAEKAKQMAERGYAVFPVTSDKTPYQSDGLKAATLDPWLAWETFEKYPKALIGVHCGRSGITVLDIDVKTDEDGNTVVDGFEALEQEWLDVPGSFSYPSLSGLGKHVLYKAPEGATFNGVGRYRGMLGVDRRAGESYIVYVSDEIADLATLTPAPEWLCDESTLRSAEAFEGTVRDWYETLEAGEPNVIVRNALARIEKKYETAGNDFDHAALVAAQFEAVRIGAEGNPGAVFLLQRIEEMFYAREGAHSRPEEEWAHEFAEGLASGIEKYGDAIQLRKDLPEYSLATAPAQVPDRLLSGTPGDKETFRELLRTLQEATSDDMYVTSVLWNSARTRDVSREWGLPFVHKRVVDARARPEPIRENPTLPTTQNYAEPGTILPTQNTAIAGTFLSQAELERASAVRTFIDTYMEASASKGFWNRSYDLPAAWTALSMAFGLKAVIPKGVALGVNLWFLSLGYSGSGKTASTAFLRYVLDLLLNDGDGYYNLGALSSPEGIMVELLTRDGKPSMIFQDEASSFFEAMRAKDYMKGLEYDFANYYMGDVPPSNKLSLKELKGKSARTSFNMNMIATPDRLLTLIDTDMFATGFMARYNFTWAEPPADDDSKYLASRSDMNIEKNAPPVTFELSMDLLHAGAHFTNVVPAWGTEDAVARLMRAHKDFDHAAKAYERYDVLEPAVTRLGRETIWKCAALLALYEGRKMFTTDDVEVALSYAQEWFADLVRVVEATSESEFAGEVAEIESYIKARGGSVTAPVLLHKFRNMIRKSPRELDDRIGFLVSSGRVLRTEKDHRITYSINGVAS